MLSVLKGFLTNKTVLAQPASAIVGFLAAWLATKGFALSPEDQKNLTEWMVGGALIIGNLIAEHVTGPGIATPTPATHFAAPPVTKAAAIFLACLLLPSIAMAQPKPKVIKTTTPTATQTFHDAVSGLIDALNAANNDFTAALKLTPAEDTLASSCWNGAIAYNTTLITQLNSVVDLQLPTPHLATTFQITRNITKFGSNGVPTPVVAACSGLAQDARTDIASLIIKVAGASGLAAMKAVIPAAP